MDFRLKNKRSIYYMAFIVHQNVPVSYYVASLLKYTFFGFETCLGYFLSFYKNKKNCLANLACVIRQCYKHCI